MRDVILFRMLDNEVAFGRVHHPVANNCVNDVPIHEQASWALILRCVLLRFSSQHLGVMFLVCMDDYHYCTLDAAQLFKVENDATRRTLSTDFIVKHMLVG